MNQDETVIDPRIQRVRDRIRRNFPKENAPLHWKKISESRIESTCGRFWVDKHGKGEAVRYTAMMKPLTPLGHRLMSAEQAKGICERHASPLDLPLPETKAPVPATIAAAPETIAPKPETKPAKPEWDKGGGVVSFDDLDGLPNDPDVPEWLK